MKKVMDRLKNKIENRSKPGKPDYTKGLSTGSTLLNLALSGKASIGWLPGALYHFVGDSNSGKTFLTLTAFAEASLNKNYDGYDFIYDGPEGGAKMDLRKFYGERVEARLQPPGPNGASPTVEDFYFNLDDRFKSGRPFIYLLDSMSALSSLDDLKKLEQDKKATRKVKKKEGDEDEEKIKGSYGVGKPKKNSSNLGWVAHKLQSTGSILIIISQTRATIGFKAKFTPKTRSGGDALTFYSDVEIWSSVKERMKRKYRGKWREIGTRCQIHVTRTRLTGKDRTVQVPIYNTYGVDDIGSMVDFLVDEEHWEYDGNMKERDKIEIHATEFKFKGKREALVQKIESEGKERELRLLVSEIWNDIEAALTVKRKARYT